MRNIRASLEVMSQEELLKMHDTIMTVLEEMGIRVPNQELINMCLELGCTAEGDVIHFPRRVMEDFIEKQRKHSPHKIGENAHPLYGYVSTQVSLVDYTTRTRRYGLRKDNLKGVKLIEHLRNIPGSNAVVVPSDVPYSIADAVTIADVQKYSKKPGGTYVLTPFGAKYVHQINELLGLRGYYLFESISPLTFKADTVAMALDFAKRGSMIGIAPMAMSSATAPTTIAGTLVIEAAEVVGSSFLVHTMSGQFPQFAASCHSLDPKTMLCSFGSPNQALFAVAIGQLARFYGVQGGGNAALTDAIMPDFQGGFEKGVGAILSSMSGLCSIGCQGIAGADQGFSFEQLVIDNEWLDYVNYLTRGFEVNDDFLGLDAIREVGIGGNFLTEEHTVDYMRDSYWTSDLFGRCDWNTWLAEGGKTLGDRAHDFVERVTAGYEDMEPVRDAETCRELDKIVADALRDAEKV